MPEPLLNTETDQRKSPLLFIVAIAALVGLILWSLYLALTKTAITGAQKQMASDIASLQKNVDILKEQKVEATQLAREWISSLDKDEIRWSGVINGLHKLVPLDVVTQKPKIQFLSYSGNRGGKLTLSAQTMEASADPFADVAELLRVFNTSSFFRDAYVPSLTRSVSQAGNTVLSFTFDVVYSEQSSVMQESPGGPNGGASSKIPRK